MKNGINLRRHVTKGLNFSDFANTEEWLKKTGYVRSHVLSEIHKMGVTITDDHE